MEDQARLLVHGGAVNDADGSHIQAKQDATEGSCQAIDLQRGALDLVEAAASNLENAPALNAGYGSVLQLDGRIRTDAAICGSDGDYAAIVNVEHIRNPVQLSRRLMAYGYHSILAGEGAQHFAKEEGFSVEPLFTDKALDDYLRARESYPVLSYDSLAAGKQGNNHQKLSTIGAVAVDVYGRLAAACSTGGTKYCYPGRVGDTPVFGAGLYCTDRIAIACTGEGDKILRRLSARRAAEYFENYGDIQAALDHAVNDLGKVESGYIGMIAVQNDGTSAISHNTNFMAYAMTDRYRDL